MCSTPKIPDPPPPPAPPPPPTQKASTVKNKNLRSRSSSRKMGTSALTVRRSSVNTGSSGTGAKINY